MVLRPALPALLALASASAALPAAAQTVDNVASASWTQDGRTHTVRSNLVSLRVEAAGAITAFRPDASGSETITLSAAACAKAGPAPQQDTRTSAVGVSATSSVVAGDGFIIRVSAPDANRDPAAADVVTVDVTSDRDLETVVLRETAPSSGVFAGWVATTADRPAVAGDCRLSVAAGEKVTAFYRPDNAAPQSVELAVLAGSGGPAGGWTFRKSVSRASAAPGDTLVYTLTLRNSGPATQQTLSLKDTASTSLRLESGTLRINGAAPGTNALIPANDGAGFVLSIDDVPARGEVRITYAMRVRPNAAPGVASNRAVLRDMLGREERSGADVRIEGELISSRMTIAGQVTAGDCSAAGPRPGIAGVRIMMEDGSFAVTDADGRYHFEGVVPGTHVLEAQTATLPGSDAKFVDCTRSSRSAGSATSRFVTGRGGSLVVADFTAVVPPTAAVSETARPLSDAAAAGGDMDFSQAGDGPIDWVFPAADHNPRARAVRVAIRHRVGQKVELRANGSPVPAVALDGVHPAPSGTYAVSVWRGIPLAGDVTALTATVRNADGTIAASLAREVHFADTALNAEIVEGQSRLVADGATNPVLAVRLRDRASRPVHAGVGGEVAIAAPYEAEDTSDQLNKLTRVGTASPRWLVEGDDGIALIRLAPTMVSGPLRLNFRFDDGDVRREQTIEAWVVPGQQKWTLVGLAEGTLGTQTVASAMEQGGRFDSDLGEHARIAFYAKGRVLGKTLLTVAYDSAKQADSQRLLGAIDPNAYYTVFADGSDRRFDAASRSKLYVRFESSSFYAIYGDFAAGFDQTELARFASTATGVKAEARAGAWHAAAFAADTATRHQRDEFQGNGLTGPYRLSRRAVVPNSETVVLEVRDRLRSELVLERTALTRFVDYDLDLLAGTIRFAQPVASRDFALNPRFIVIDYAVENGGKRAVSAGARADATSTDSRLRAGVSVLTDETEKGRTDLAAVDVKARLSDATEVRAEAAISRHDGDLAAAWLFELEHHTPLLDLLAYARSADADYGMGQQNRAELGRQKFGADARMNIASGLSVTGSVWRDAALGDDPARRQAAELRAAYRYGATDARIGIATFADQAADGTRANSTLLEAGATQRLYGNRLEVAAATSVAIAGPDSLDLPTRHRLSTRFAVSPSVALVGSYELADGAGYEARTLRGGFELKPWAGGRLVTAVGQQGITENGRRSFAAFGLAQSWQASPELSLDASVDGNWVIGGFTPTKIVNPNHPVASGGFIGDNGGLSEDFTAVSVGAGYRKDLWNAVLRAEYRDGQFANRRGLSLGAIRQLGNGSIVGSGLTWTRARGGDGSASSVLDAAVSAAWRPDNSPWAVLAKLEYRADSVNAATAGDAGAAGQTALRADGDASSRRFVGSLSANWSPMGRDLQGFYQRTEVGLFVGGRYGFEAADDISTSGVTALAGLDVRVGILERLELGGSATVRSNLDSDTTDYSFGPQIGFVPSRDLLLSLGYNVAGFSDADFAGARSTTSGLFTSLKLKFDSNVFGLLGLAR